MQWVLGLTLLTGATDALPQQSLDGHRHESWERVAARVRRATVTVSVQRRDGAGAFGSGFLVSSDGIIATAAHVVRGAASAFISLSSGETFAVRGLLAFDASRDFALLRIAGFGLPTLSLANSDRLDIGAPLAAFGAPLGYEGTVSDGLLSGVRIMDGTRLFQISIPISEGSSGGPVVDNRGFVVGIVVSMQPGAQALNFALPISYLRGELSLASSEAPVPLAQANYGSGSEVGMLCGAPNPVDDSLQIDPDLLDGVQWYSVNSDRDETITTSGSYLRTSSHSGAAVLEQYTKATSDRAHQKRFVDERRVEVDRHLATIRGYYQRTSHSPDVAEFSERLTVDSGRFSISGLFSRDLNDVLPRGSVTEELLPPLIASLPDSPLRSVYVWVISHDTVSIASIPARIDFGTMDTAAVLQASPGAKCGPTTRVHAVRVPVLEVTLTVGPKKEAFPVLAKRPHLRVDDVRCLSLPRLP